MIVARIEVTSTPLRNAVDKTHWGLKGRLVRSYAKELAYGRWTVEGKPSTIVRDTRRSPLAFPVSILIIRYQEKGPLADEDGVLGGAKQLLDALTMKHKSGVGIIRDDSPRYVKSMRGISIRGDTNKTVLQLIIHDEEDIGDSQTCSSRVVQTHDGIEGAGADPRGCQAPGRSAYLDSEEYGCPDGRFVLRYMEEGGREGGDGKGWKTGGERMADGDHGLSRISQEDEAWLVETGARIRDQDNRSTSSPVFMVQQDRRIYGVDPAYHDGIRWEEDPRNRYSLPYL